MSENNATLHVIDIIEFKDKIGQLGIKLEFNISSALRLFIAELLPDVDKVLFIDSDTYISCGLVELYNTNLGDYPCAMVLDQPICGDLLNECDLDDNSPYYNAGVILINLKYWREHGLQDKLISCYTTRKHFSVDDQGVINTVLSKHTLRLPYKYNAMKIIFSSNYKRFCNANVQVGFATRDEFLEAKNHPVIVHFNGPAIRPWMRWCGHPYTKHFRKCLLENFPKFKLWIPKQSKSFLIRQYIWNRFISRLYSYIE